MKRNGKRILVFGIMLAAAFVIWTVLIQTVDVKPAGESGTPVGFAAVNTRFFAWTGVHTAIYTLTDWLGLVPIIVCMVFGVAGFAQMVKRRSLLKVDYDIILLGIYYTVVIFCYLIFEMIPVNFRPVLIGGQSEASYPSSTTLLVLSVMPTLAFEAKRRVKNIAAMKIIVGIAMIFSVFTVIGRLVSGVHWLTDIVGGVLLSAGLFFIYKGAVLLIDRKGD